MFTHIALALKERRRLEEKWGVITPPKPRAGILADGPAEVEEVSSEEFGEPLPDPEREALRAELEAGFARIEARRAEIAAIVGADPDAAAPDPADAAADEEEPQEGAPRVRKGKTIVREREGYKDMERGASELRQRIMAGARKELKAIVVGGQTVVREVTIYPAAHAVGFVPLDDSPTKQQEVEQARRGCIRSGQTAAGKRRASQANSAPFAKRGKTRPQKVAS